MINSITAGTLLPQLYLAVWSSKSYNYSIGLYVNVAMFYQISLARIAENCSYITVNTVVTVK